MIEVINVSEKFDISSTNVADESFTYDSRYRKGVFWALQNVSFSVQEGETVAIIGENGSGKTTLLKIIAGVLTPDKGSISCPGKVAALLELGFGFNPELSGKENISLSGMLLGMSAREIQEQEETIIEFADIGDFIYEPVKTYSSGMGARLSFSIAIHSNPDVFVIDEVLITGDEYFQKKCFAKLEELLKQKKTIICASHSHELVKKIAKRAILLREGCVLKDGAVQDVVEYYKMIMGRREGIAFLDAGKYQLIFNNGKIFILRNKKLFSSSEIGYFILVVDNDEYYSYQAQWRIICKNDTEVTFEGNYYFSTIKQKIHFSLSNRSFQINSSFLSEQRPSKVMLCMAFKASYDKGFLNIKTFEFTNEFHDFLWTHIPMPHYGEVYWCGLSSAHDEFPALLIHGKDIQPVYMNAPDRSRERIMICNSYLKTEEIHLSVDLFNTQQELERAIETMTEKCTIKQGDMSVLFFDNSFIIKKKNVILTCDVGLILLCEHSDGRLEYIKNLHLEKKGKMLIFTSPHSSIANVYNLSVSVTKEQCVVFKSSGRNVGAIRSIHVILLLPPRYNQIYMRKDIARTVIEVKEENGLLPLFEKELKAIPYRLFGENILGEEENMFCCAAITDVAASKAYLCAFSERIGIEKRRVLLKHELQDVADVFQEATLKLYYLHSYQEKNEVINKLIKINSVEIEEKSLRVLWEAGHLLISYGDVCLTGDFGLVLLLHEESRVVELSDVEINAHKLSRCRMQLHGKSPSFALSFVVDFTLEEGLLQVKLLIHSATKSILPECRLAIILNERYTRWFTDDDKDMFSSEPRLNPDGKIMIHHEDILQYIGAESYAAVRDKSMPCYVCESVDEKSFLYAQRDQVYGKNIVGVYLPNVTVTSEMTYVIGMQLIILIDDEARKRFVYAKMDERRIQDADILMRFSRNKLHVFYKGKQISKHYGLFFNIIYDTKSYIPEEIKLIFTKKDDSTLVISGTSHDTKVNMTIVLHLSNNAVHISKDIVVEHYDRLTYLCIAFILDEGHDVYYQNYNTRPTVSFSPDDMWYDSRIHIAQRLRYCGLMASNVLPGVHIDISKNILPFFYTAGGMMRSRIIGVETNHPPIGNQQSCTWNIPQFNFLTYVGQQNMLEEREKINTIYGEKIRNCHFDHQTLIYYDKNLITSGEGVQGHITHRGINYPLAAFIEEQKKISVNKIQKTYFIGQIGLRVEQVYQIEKEKLTIFCSFVARDACTIDDIHFSFFLKEAFDQGMINFKKFPIDSTSVPYGGNEMLLMVPTPEYTTAQQIGLYSRNNESIPFLSLSGHNLHIFISSITKATRVDKATVMHFSCPYVSLNAAWNYTFNCSFVLECVDPKERERFIEQQKKLYEIASGDISLIYMDKRLHITYKGQEITNGRGMTLTVVKNDIVYSSTTEICECHKIDEVTMDIHIRIEAFSRTIIVRLHIRDEYRIEFSMSIDQVIDDIKINFYLSLQDSFCRWFTPDRDGLFESKYDYETEALRLSLYEKKVVGLRQSETKVKKPLVLTYKSESMVNEYLVAKQISIFEEATKNIGISRIIGKDEVKEKGQYEVIRGSFFLCELDRIVEVVNPFEHCSIIKSDALALLFDDGRARIFYNNNELTKKLGFYTSYCYEDQWADSHHHATWHVELLNNSTLKAIGRWRDLPIEQQWYLQLHENKIIWTIYCLYGEPFRFSSEQVNIMLSSAYTKWFLKKEKTMQSLYGLRGHNREEFFPSEFNKDYGGEWDVRWWGNPHVHCIGALNDDLKDHVAYPSLGLFYTKFTRSFQGVILNSDDEYAARVIRITKLDTCKGKKSKAKKLLKYFSGIIEINI